MNAALLGAHKHELRLAIPHADMHGDSQALDHIAEEGAKVGQGIVRSLKDVPRRRGSPSQCRCPT